MIYTVTLNPAIDKTVEIPDFTAGKVNRVCSLRLDAGGKGINVTKCLKNLGTQSIAAMLCGGSSGEKLLAMLARQQVQTLALSVPGETRTNLKIIDPAGKTNTDINEPGPEVTSDILDTLKHTIGERIQPGDGVILSGSLPKGAGVDTYRDWCSYFRSLGVRVYLDADGEAMKQGITAIPYMIKPNDEELSRLMGRPVDTLEELVQAGKELLATGIQEVVISLGGKGALFVSREGIYLAQALQVPVRSTVGAGDSMVAAMAYGGEKQLPRQQLLRLAVAMGAASVMCDGTQAPDAETVHTLAKEVIIQEVNL